MTNRSQVIPILAALVAVVIIVSILFLAITGTPGNASSSDPNTRLSVEMYDFGYLPNNIDVPAGKVITLTISNTGKVKHEFVILKKGRAAVMPWGDVDEPKVYWETEVEPGAAQTVTFTVPSDIGTYQVVCGQPGHIERGMSAVLHVQ